MRLILGWMGLAGLMLPMAGAQSASFVVSQHGQKVGTVSYRQVESAAGVASNSLIKVHMEGLDYDLSKSEELTAGHHLRHAEINAAVNGSAVNMGVDVDSTGVVLKMAANGHLTTSTLARHTGAVLLADFDAGAIDTLLRLYVAQNGRDLWAVIPKQAGSVQSVQLVSYADEKGTVNGKEVVVHHLQLRAGDEQIELFTNSNYRLQQAEYMSQGFAVVREGFVLTPPAKPLAAPVE